MAETNLANGRKLTFGERVKKFFKDTKAELKKVTWPTKEQLIHNTGVIIVFILIITAILSVLDFAFGRMFFALSSILSA
ncbi:MAG: preprotein translocase subunit SecE [Clostridia bacterium]|nr:preprotein translocase subunit SecE [Clostridia bacterium]MBQ3471766.1 preprotein translocase subunit SecE [Clostridia bacterium]MBQ6530749.1 preprotein translocase subunit SecE [Clostridia bacterium]MBR0470061.1 preprotein translocase subunit SecE [Clostridia bacterium]